MKNYHNHNDSDYVPAYVKEAARLKALTGKWMFSVDDDGHVSPLEEGRTYDHIDNLVIIH